MMHEPISFNSFIEKEFAQTKKMIAHCEDSPNKETLQSIHGINTLILVGPEGDFTHEEIVSAINNGYQPVTLGSTRLRSETAGIVAAALMANHSAISS
jgi:16S rRNA (uracil1498-N3)-methyltransferase